MAIVVLAIGCAVEQEKKQNGKMDDVLFAKFKKGAPESDYVDILKTARWKVTESNEMAKWNLSESRGAHTAYRWDADDGKDGTSYFVFVSGNPAIISGSLAIIYDK